MESLTNRQKLDQFIESQKEQQGENLMIDFDKAVREERAEPVRIKFEGDVFELPSVAPAWLPLFVNKHQNKDGLMTDEASLDMITRLLGKDFADKIMNGENSFVSFELINDRILMPVMQHWGMDVQSDSDSDSDKKKLKTRVS